MGPTPVMSWGESPVAGQPPTWPPPSPLARYWPPPPPAGYRLPPPPASHPDQSFSIPPPTFQPGILAVTVGTSSWRASPVVGNASVDGINAASTMTFFFTIDGKSLVLTFNCSIRNTSKCRTTRLLIHLCLQASFSIGQMRLHRYGSKHGRIR
jgi:hypothetical protein